MAMWSNCMQFVSEEGVRVGELEQLARTKTNLNGMERWGYVMVGPDPSDKRPKPPRSAWLIRATPAGRKAREIWKPLFGVIEARWEERFGKDAVQQLREALRALLEKMDLDLPDCLPILGYGMFSAGPSTKPLAARGLDGLPLSALLSRVLLAFAIEFERVSAISLAIYANVVRALNETGVPVRDLPSLVGVSKEAISMAMGVLQKMGIAVVGADRQIRLTEKGLKARDACHRSLNLIEERWQTRFGTDAIGALRSALEDLVEADLFLGLKPYPDGWRASVRKPETLPHYPMVLHRGGYPDGS